MLKLNNTCRKHPNITQLLKTEIYDRRRRMGISQYALAEMVGLTRNCIQQMECYQHLPKAETIFNIMLALDFSDEERNEFVIRYLNAYYKDRVFQQEQEKELAGIV